MIVETPRLPFWQWFLAGTPEALGALLWFLVVAFSLALAALVAGYLVAAVRYGTVRAGDLTYQVVRTGIGDLLALSPRRTLALAWLAVKESLRGRVLVALAIFLLILMFAVWFLGSNYAQPARLYVNFVLTATTYLVLLLALFLSAFSLPNDVRQRTIHTIVTKPVRAGEIVLGRILGFTAVGTVVLAVMGVVSYLFVVRSLRHTHQVDVYTLTEVAAANGKSESAGRRGRTTLSAHHRHEVLLDAGGGRTTPNHGHWHSISPRQAAGRLEYDVGPPVDLFQARVPVYGKLRFKDATGADVEKGISVGNEWTYRSYIEGGTLAAAIWTFSGIDEATYPDGLPLELLVSVFRTYKGNIEEGILGSLVVRHPTDPQGRSSDLILFRAKEYTVNQFRIPRELTDSKGQPLDLFRDLVDEQGRVDVWIQCLDPAQYYGVAQADCYLRARDGSFVVNFIKGYGSIWVQMLMVTSFAVAASTFLSGPVAMLLTLAVMVVGFFKDFILGVATGRIEGGGPVESLVRLVSHRNVTSELEEGLSTSVIQTIDAGLVFLMRIFVDILPDFRQLSTVRNVADGYDISANLLAQDIVTGLGYLAGLFLAGFFLFRTREVAR
jgi:hypothetical protein